MKSRFISVNRKLPAAVAGAILMGFLFANVQAILAASATWATTPPTTNWHSAFNWTPLTVPNGPNDTATFQTSSQRNISISANAEVNEMIFNAGANNFTFTNGTGTTLTISGTGITNNSGLVQAFIISGQLAFINSANAGTLTNITNGNNATITFSNSASAGSAAFDTYNGSTLNFQGSSTAANATFTHSSPADLNFYGATTAGHATFMNSGQSRMTFYDGSNAGSANITLVGTNIPKTLGSRAYFRNNSSAANALFNVNGGPPGGAGAALVFFYESTAGASTLIANSGGQIGFVDLSRGGTATMILNAGSLGGFGGNSTGDMAHVRVFSTGTFDINGHATPGVSVGSIEGDGYVLVAPNRLTVGTNNADTTFAGHIQDNRFGSGATGGSLVKAGTGTLALTNTNTYTGGTTIETGTLRASHDGVLGGAPENGGFVSVGPIGTLTLDSGATNDYIANRASLVIVNGSTVNLNFSGPPDRLRSLIVDGVAQPPGVYGGPSSAPNQLPQISGTGTILATTKAVSRKIHGDAGAFDIDLPLVGPRGIECRAGGPNQDYEIVLTFYNNVTFDQAAVISGTGTIANASGNGTNTVTLNLTGVADAQVINIMLFALNDGTDTTFLLIPIGVLIGDVNGNGIVNASDVAQVKAQLGQPVTASNFRADVNPNGAINASDVIWVKLLSGTSLP